MSRIRALPLATTLGGGGHFWEQTARADVAGEREEQVRLLLQQQEADVHQRRHDHRERSARIDVLLPVLRQPGSVVVAGEQPLPPRVRLLAPSGNLGQPRADESIADPLAVGVTDNNPQSLVPGYVQLIQNYHGRVGATDTGSHNPNYRGNFAASYVTGTHALKAGMDLNGATRWSDNNSIVPYSYVVSTLANNGVGLGIPVPQSLTLRSDGCTDPLAPPGQRWHRRREHVDPGSVRDSRGGFAQQGEQRGRRLRAGQVDDEPADAQHGLPVRLVQLRESRIPPRSVDH